jgi:small multidrug resistance pump
MPQSSLPRASRLARPSGKAAAAQKAEKIMLQISPWTFLGAAILSEVTGTMLMKASEGYTKLAPSIGMFICYAVSLSALTYAVREIDIGIAYAVWSGAGTILIAMIGFAVFKQSLSIPDVVSIVLIVAGVVGLKLNSTAG